MEERGTHLSLEHQLSGEQHGLVAEGVGGLHAAGRVPGAARAVDAWPSGDKKEIGLGRYGIGLLLLWLLLLC